MSWCETEMQKFMPLVKQNVEVFILGGQRIDQKRNKGWWRGSRERIEMEAQKVTELTIEEEDNMTSVGDISRRQANTREISDIFHFTAIHFLPERHSAMVLIII